MFSPEINFIERSTRFTPLLQIHQCPNLLLFSTFLTSEPLKLFGDRIPNSFYVHKGTLCDSIKFSTDKKLGVLTRLELARLARALTFFIYINNILKRG
jgi:hypothetical protein